MAGPSIRRILSLATALCFLFSCKDPVAPQPPSPPEEEDVVTRVQVPGAYGVKGGDQILSPSRQSSVLVYGKSFSYRILDPSTLTIVSLSGLPEGLDVGDKVSFQYRLARHGATLAQERYENLPVVKVQDAKAWIKKDDETFFVIDLL